MVLAPLPRDDTKSNGSMLSSFMRWVYDLVSPEMTLRAIPSSALITASSVTPASRNLVSACFNHISISSSRWRLETMRCHSDFLINSSACWRSTKEPSAPAPSLPPCSSAFFLWASSCAFNSSFVRRSFSFTWF